MTVVYLSLLVESILDEQILRKLLDIIGHYTIYKSFVKGGKAQLQASASKFNQASQGSPYLMLTDLDQDECAPSLIRSWLPYGKNHNFIFRVAVHEVEAWFPADRENIAEFLQVSPRKIPHIADAISDPKKALIDLARQSNSQQIRENIVPEPQSTSKVGKGYNEYLTKFIWNHWQLANARQNSNSLDRAYHVLLNFEPIYPKE